MPGTGPCSDIEVWLEGGPNHAPTFTKIPDLSKKYILELGLMFGDVLVVQEHRSRLQPRDDGQPLQTAPEWIAARAAGG